MATVTIDKAYLETLMRRAQFHTDGADFTAPVNLSTVTIPTTDYDSLLTQARQYANLRRNLFRGGVAEDVLAILTKDDNQVNENEGATVYSTIAETMEGNSFLSPQALKAAQYTGANIGSGRFEDYTYGRNANYTPRNGEPRIRDTNSFQNHSQTNDESMFMPDDRSDVFCEEGNGNNDSRTRFTRPQYEKFARRTVLLVNLPDNPTHAEIVDVVRGGMLLDLYVRVYDRCASISFLEAAHAQEFFHHVKRHDLYIRGKRVEIRWNERQFILPGHVANKIGIGATRNLVVHNRNPAHTEEAIRDDLEHIHNLAVIRVSIDGDKAFISTNSVHNAMFARTCMMSRATYKGSKIEWDDDECALPLIKPQQIRRENTVSKKKNVAPVLNRFHLLNMDGTEDDSLTDDDHDTSGLTFASAVSTSLVASG